MDKKTQEFITRHRLTDEIMDAEGKAISDISHIMKLKNILFAYNTTSCSKGHTIRSRSGHCIVCQPAGITFIRRSMETGYIYIAGSIRKQCIKIGMTTVPIDHRLSRLNSRGVGSTSDWVVLKSIKCHLANRHEMAIHSLLAKYQIDGDFYGETASREMFRCSFQKADSIMSNYLETNQVSVLESKTYIASFERYNFRNLIRP